MKLKLLLDHRLIYDDVKALNFIAAVAVEINNVFYRHQTRGGMFEIIKNLPANRKCSMVCLVNI